MSTPKPWYQSWTLWFNGLSAIVAGVIAMLPFIASVLSMPQLSSVIPPEAMKWVVVINGVINLFLRFRTTRPIGDDGSNPTHTDTEFPS